MNITENELLDLTNKINNKLKNNFAKIHLSRNLMDTIEIKRTSYGYEIEIPAEMYDVKRYIDEGVIVYTGEGSYASEVNETGGFSKFHKNYVENAIIEGITEWISENKINVKKVSLL